MWSGVRNKGWYCAVSIDPPIWFLAQDRKSYQSLLVDNICSTRPHIMSASENPFRNFISSLSRCVWLWWCVLKLSINLYYHRSVLHVMKHEFAGEIMVNLMDYRELIEREVREIRCFFCPSDGSNICTVKSAAQCRFKNRFNSIYQWDEQISVYR